MIELHFQEEEADIVERLIDLILTDESASKAVFKCGAERRAALRASKKIHWAKVYKCKVE